MERGWNVAREIADEGMKKGIYSGYQVNVADEKNVLFQYEGGNRKVGKEQNLMEREMFFDLASLTKPIATATTALKMMEKGYFSLDESLSGYIPGEFHHRFGKVSFRHLLNHSSGVRAWYPTYSRGVSREGVLNLILNLEPVYEPGEKNEYSCLGYILLGLLLEKIGEGSLDQLAQKFVFEPLEMERTQFKPLEKGYREEDFVFQEKDHKIEKGMVNRAGLSFSGWREGFAPGEVNDGNAAYSMGGISGNAGLFSNASDLTKFGQAWLLSLEGKGFLPRSLASLAVREQQMGLKEFGLGWVLLKNTLKKPAGKSSMAPFLPTPLYPEIGPAPAGELFSDRSFGHTGFTGSSIFIDPEYKRVVVFLANHLHPQFKPGLNNVRARLHNVICSIHDGGDLE